MKNCIQPRYTLFCPGPVNVTPQVATAYCDCAFSHREETFSRLLRHVQRGLLFIAGVDTTDDYSALVITGSGTAANEAVLVSAVPPEATVVVLGNGEFGERLTAISSVYNHTVALHSAWGEDLDLRRLERLLNDDPPAMVAMVHHETSTGLLNPIEAVGALCRRYGVMLFVDGVSSFAADPITLPESGITFLTTSSGKAIGGYPGLSFVMGRNEDFSRLAEYPVRNHYLHLYRHFQIAMQEEQTPNTPAVSLMAAVDASLQDICGEGLEQRYRRLAGLAAHMRAGLVARNLYRKMDKRQSVVLTNACLPIGRSFSDLQQGLKENGYIIYDAKGPLRGEFFQVSTIGDITKSDIDRFLAALDPLLPTTAHP